MLNTKRSTWGGSRTGAGRRRKAAAQRYGEVWVRLSMSQKVVIGEHVIVFRPVLYDNPPNSWYVDGQRFTDYAAARDEFVRRVNDTRRNHAS